MQAPSIDVLERCPGRAHRISLGVVVPPTGSIVLRSLWIVVGAEAIVMYGTSC